MSIITYPSEKINIVVALPCEAKPLVEYYKLKKNISINTFAIYCNTTQNINLIVSGLGKIKAAAAVSFLQQYTANVPTSFYCNIGIAGSANYPVGELIVADKITDQSSGINFYPYMGYLTRVKSARLVTHDIPQQHYPELGMIDMEASGFFQSANLFVSKEQIQALKIISDNNHDSMRQINKHYVEKLISVQLLQIDEIIQTMLGFSQQEAFFKRQPRYLDEFLSKWHFSKFQQQKLIDYLRRFEITQQNPYSICEDYKSAKEVLNFLSKV